MTESEWLTSSNPRGMLEYVANPRSKESGFRPRQHGRYLPRLRGNGQGWLLPLRRPCTDHGRSLPVLRRVPRL